MDELSRCATKHDIRLARKTTLRICLLQIRSRADRSLELFIQRESPGKDKEPNWLPAPAKGPFTMYWPKAEVLDGSWKPAGIKLVQ
jgi:hypothetical protein